MANPDARSESQETISRQFIKTQNLSQDHSKNLHSGGPHNGLNVGNIPRGQPTLYVPVFLTVKHLKMKIKYEEQQRRDGVLNQSIHLMTLACPS